MSAVSFYHSVDNQCTILLILKNNSLTVRNSSGENSVVCKNFVMDVGMSEASSWAKWNNKSDFKT